MSGLDLFIYSLGNQIDDDIPLFSGMCALTEELDSIPEMGARFQYAEYDPVTSGVTVVISGNGLTQEQIDTFLVQLETAVNEPRISINLSTW